MIADARRAAAALLDLYESYGTAVADFQVKLAWGTSSEPVAFLAHTYADFTRDVTAAQAAAGRSLLRR